MNFYIILKVLFLLETMEMDESRFSGRTATLWDPWAPKERATVSSAGSLDW